MIKLNGIVNSTRIIYIRNIYYKCKKAEPEELPPEDLPEEGTELTVEDTSVIIRDGTKVIAGAAFCNVAFLTNISIPNGLISIGDWSFGGCLGLKNIVIPDSVKNIGWFAFSSCSSLTSITIPNSVISIEAGIFYDCGKLEKIEVAKNNPVYHSEGNCLINTKNKDVVAGCKESIIPSDGSVTSISEQAFNGCAGLLNISIPDSVTNIGADAFRDCYDLISLTMSDNVTSIGYGAFYNCFSLSQITYSNGVKVIESSTFSGCSNLTNFIVSESVNYIEDRAFEECTSLENIVIPDSVTYIGDDVFYNTAYYSKDSNWKNDVLYIGNHLIEAKYSISGAYDIKDGTKTIAGSAFEYCRNLTSITIPDSVTSIGVSAFRGCTGLTSITIPSGVTYIGDYALGYYSNWEDLYIKLDNFTIYGYPNTAAETYASENGFTFVSLDEEHTHTFSEWTVTKVATCTEEGEETRSCSCGESQTRKTEKKAHDLNHVENKSTCTVKGVSYDICADCGETFNYAVLSLASHTFSAWTVTKEATSFEFGERVRTCLVCGFEESEKLEKLPVSEVKDEKTGVSVVCPDGSFDGKVEIEVTETFDGTSYNILNNEKGNFKNRLFDISTLVDGKKAQPNGSVMVKIPLPDGYSPDTTVVYYITNDGKLEKIESRVENGYVVFETTHFSYYAVVDEGSQSNPSANCSCACHKKGIVKFFFKIRLFFQKIFKKNKICKCGAQHY